jgi:hypothetical protein
MPFPHCKETAIHWSRFRSHDGISDSRRFAHAIPTGSAREAASGLGARSHDQPANRSRAIFDTHLAIRKGVCSGATILHHRARKRDHGDRVARCLSFRHRNRASLLGQSHAWSEDGSCTNVVIIASLNHLKLIRSRITEANSRLCCRGDASLKLDFFLRRRRLDSSVHSLGRSRQGGSGRGKWMRGWARTRVSSSRNHEEAAATRRCSPPKNRVQPVWE